MNVEKELRAAAAALRSEYDDYDVVAAEQRLDRLVVASGSHPSAGAEPDEDSWRMSAGCRVDSDPFRRGLPQRQAKLVCFSCPVRTECLADALDHRVEHGVWGGMTERERRALLRRRPDVESWQDLLERARRLIGDHAAWEDLVIG